MNFASKLSFFKLIVVLVVLSKCCGVQSQNGDTKKIVDPMHETNQTVESLEVLQPNDNSSDNFSYLVTGGYRPRWHTLAKYLVSISYGPYSMSVGDNHMCGGAIIKPNLILTAAHCIEHADPSLFVWPPEVKILAGTPNRLRTTRQSQERTGEKQIAHPLYDYSTQRNDIALIRLQSELELNENVQVIPLATEPVRPGTTCTVIGWGRIFERGPMAAEVLYGNVTVLSTAECESFDPLYVNTALCASSNDSEIDACSGDSGGPLICDNKLVGIVSYGVGCASPFFPGFYTDVYQFLDWIANPRTVSSSGKIDPVVVYAIIVLALCCWL